MPPPIVVLDAEFGALMPPINLADINDFFLFHHNECRITSLSY
jgi:hypothetical protein